MRLMTLSLPKEPGTLCASFYPFLKGTRVHSAHHSPLSKENRVHSAQHSLLFYEEPGTLCASFSPLIQGVIPPRYTPGGVYAGCYIPSMLPGWCMYRVLHTQHASRTPYGGNNSG